MDRKRKRKLQLRRSAGGPDIDKSASQSAHLPKASGELTPSTQSAGTHSPKALVIHEVLCLAFAFMLLFAAGMKVYELLDNRFLERTGPLLLVTAELVLALCLISGLWRFMAWGMAMITLAAFIGATVPRLLAGDASCGCFGALTVPPAVTLTIDTLLLIGLALFRPERHGAWWRMMHTGRLRHRRIALSAALAMTLLLAMTVGLVLNPMASAEARRVHGHEVVPNETAPAAGSERGGPTVGPGISHHHGDPAPPPSRIDHEVGYVDPGQVRRQRIELRNPSDEPIRIRRSHAECRCTHLIEVPQLIPPRSRAEVIFDFDAPEQRTLYAKRILLDTDHPDTPEIVVTVRARIGLPVEIAPDVVFPEPTMQHSGAPSARASGAMRPSPDGATDAHLAQAHSGDIDPRAHNHQAPSHPDVPPPSRSHSSQEALQGPTIAVSNHGSEPVRLLFAITDQADIVPQVSREPIPPGGRVHLPLQNRSTPIERGRTVRITLHTDHPYQRTVQASVRIGR